MLTPLDFFADHTYRMVLATTALIGLVAGALGSFAYLRRQSLISDVISHSALPGALIAFLIGVGLLGGDGRSMLGLMVGAVVTGTLAALMANRIAVITKLRIDTTMAVTLTVFFAVGMLLLRHITNGDYPGKGGVQDYLFGNAASITLGDLVTTAAVGALALIVMGLYWKEYALRTFDPVLSTVLGFRPRVIDMIMFSTVVIATVVGVKAVGLVLMVAFVVTPPAAARQWVTRLPSMVALSGLLGAVGAGLGAYLSIAWGDIPTGPLIVLCLFVIFVVSILFAPRRSIIARVVRRSRQRRALLTELEGVGMGRIGSTGTRL